jgi:hypothetical protein
MIDLASSVSNSREVSISVIRPHAFRSAARLQHSGSQDVVSRLFSIEAMHDTEQHVIVPSVTLMKYKMGR